MIWKMDLRGMGSVIEKCREKWNQLSKPTQASIAVIVCKVILMAISTLSTPFFTRIMSMDQYGIFTIIASWYEVILVFTTFELGGSIFQQALVKKQFEKKELQAGAAGLGTLGVLLFFLIYLPFSGWINGRVGISLTTMTAILIFSWTTHIYQIWVSSQKNDFKYKKMFVLAVFVAIAEALGGIATVLLVKDNQGEARFWWVTLVETVTYLPFFISFAKGGKLINKKVWKYFLPLCIPLIPHYLTRILLNQSDKLMIKFLESEAEAGLYGLGHSIAWMLCVFTGALIYSINPWLFQRIKKSELDKIGKVAHGTIFLVGIAGLALITVSPEAIYIFSPEEYHSAMWVIPPLVISVFFMYMYNVFTCFSFYFEKSGVIMLISLSGGILNVVLNYIFIGQYGWIAAGYTTLFSYLCFAVAHYICMKKLIKSKLNNAKVLNGKIIVGIAVLVVVTAAGIMLLYEYPLIRYSILLVALLIMFYKRKTIMEIINMKS